MNAKSRGLVSSGNTASVCRICARSGCENADRRTVRRGLRSSNVISSRVISDRKGENGLPRGAGCSASDTSLSSRHRAKIRDRTRCRGSIFMGCRRPVQGVIQERRCRNNSMSVNPLSIDHDATRAVLSPGAPSMRLHRHSAIPDSAVRQSWTVVFPGLAVLQI